MAWKWTPWKVSGPKNNTKKHEQKLFFPNWLCQFTLTLVSRHSRLNLFVQTNKNRYLRIPNCLIIIYKMIHCSACFIRSRGMWSDDYISATEGMGRMRGSRKIGEEGRSRQWERQMWWKRLVSRPSNPSIECRYQSPWMCRTFHRLVPSFFQHYWSIPVHAVHIC